MKTKSEENGNGIENLPKIVELQGKTDLPYEEAIKQYNPLKHDVFNETIRKKKIIQKPTGQKDADGNNGVETVYEEVNRIAFPLQKLIVNRRVAFMNVGAMQIKCSPQTDKGKSLLKMVEKCREDNKLRYKSKDIARRMMSELQVAELWYSEDANKGYWADLAPNGVVRMRMKILSPALGDELLPVFNANGDLVYFGRKYKTRKDLTSINLLEANLINNEDIEHFDIYSQDAVLKFTKAKEGWIFIEKTTYSYGKMPIIYYSQPQSEWADVQSAINRIETAISNLSDVVDYNGSPILVAKGEIKGFASKGERGKVFEVETGGDLGYVSWDQAPASIQLELDTLINFVYTCTQTPNISFEEMKGLGGTSGVAFDRIFMDPHLAAQGKLDDVYGECMQRQLNFLKSACIAINNNLKSEAELSMVPEIPLFRIDDEKETIEKLRSATGDKQIMSQKQAVYKLGYTDDNETEYAQILKENKATEPVKTENL